MIALKIPKPGKPEGVKPSASDIAPDGQCRVFELQDFETGQCPETIRAGYAVILVTCGQGYLTMGFHRFACAAGQLFVLHPGCLHSIDFRYTKGWLLHFNEEAYDLFAAHYPLFEGRGLFDEDSDRISTKLPGMQLRILDRLLNKMYRRPQAGESFNTIKRRLFYFLLKVIRLSPPPAKVNTESWEDMKIRELNILLETHLGDAKYCSFYSSRLNLSPGRLNSLLKKRYQKTIQKLVIERKAAESMKLLRDTNLSIACISERLGFADSGYFGAFCVRIFGKSPGKLRSKCVTRTIRKSVYLL